VKIKVKKLRPNAVIPVYSTEGAASFDLYATSVNGETDGRYLYPGDQIVVGTGLAFEIPPGWMMRIAPRSGLAFQHGVEAFPGVIDSDYRGEVKILLRCWPLGDGDWRGVFIRSGDRIAQAFICEVPRVSFDEVSDLSDTSRGENGFGSTGV